MRTRPADLDEPVLIRALSQHWGLEVAALEYVAVGGGGHHWRGANVWLTVDDLDLKPFLGRTRAETLAALRTALELAASLQKGGLDFVVAPRTTRGGDVLVPLALHYALTLHPLLDGTTYSFGQPLPALYREQLLDLLIRLHQATPRVRAKPVPIEIAQRHVITNALADLEQAWSGGPYAEPARQAVAAHHADLTYLLATFDRLSASVTQRGAPLVVSHGEPHPANLMRLDNRLLLLDWDTVGLAPPERDLCWLAEDPDLLARYAAAVQRPIDGEALRLYRLRWQLDDVAYALSRLRAPHADSIEVQLSSTTLARSLEVAEWMR